MKLKLFMLSLLVCPILVFSHSQSEDIHVETLSKSTASWDGAPLPQYPTGKPEITILKITIAPHTKLPLHHHPVINAGVLTKGELTVYAVDGSTKTIKAGDSLIELVNKKHYGANERDEPAEIIVFYAGTEGKPITIKDSK